MPEIIQMPSPNCHGPARRAPHVDTLVIHYTASDSEIRDLRWLCNPDARASAHYLIGRTGKIWQLVPDTCVAWHAGNSEINARSIGIELANVGTVSECLTGSTRPWWYWTDNGVRVAYSGPKPVKAGQVWPSGREVSGWWEPYPDAQLAALDWLLGKIGERYPTAARNLLGHDEVDQKNKQDPGPVFPWERYRPEVQGPVRRWRDE
jgi:N-acetylmuramoyl-L-alanine amidase